MSTTLIPSKLGAHTSRESHLLAERARRQGTTTKGPQGGLMYALLEIPRIPQMARPAESHKRSRASPAVWQQSAAADASQVTTLIEGLPGKLASPT